MSTDIPCILNIMSNMRNSYCLQTTPLDGAMYIKKKIAGEDNNGDVTQFQFLTQQWCQLSRLLSPHWNSLIKIGDPVVIIGKFRAVDKKLFRLEETDVTEHDISSANALCNLNTPYIPRLTEAHWSGTSSLSEAFELKKKCSITTFVNAKGNLTSFSKETKESSVLGWYPSNMQSLERKQWSVMEVRTWTLFVIGCGPKKFKLPSHSREHSGLCLWYLPKTYCCFRFEIWNLSARGSHYRYCRFLNNIKSRLREMISW